MSVPIIKPINYKNENKKTTCKRTKSSLVLHTLSGIIQILAYIVIIIAVFSANIFKAKINECDVYGGLYSTCAVCPESILKLNFTEQCDDTFLYIRDGIFTKSIGAGSTYLENVKSKFFKVNHSSNLPIKVNQMLSEEFIINEDNDLQIDYNKPNIVGEDISNFDNDVINFQQIVNIAINDNGNLTDNYTPITNVPAPKSKDEQILINISSLFFTDIFDTLINKNYSTNIHACCYMLFMIGIAIFTAKLITMCLFFIKRIGIADVTLGIIIFILFIIPASLITYYLAMDINNAKISIFYYSTFYLIWISTGLVCIATLFDILALIFMKSKSVKGSKITRELTINNKL